MGCFPSSADPNRGTVRARFWFTSLGAGDGLHFPRHGFQSSGGLRVEGARFERLAVLRRDDPGCVRRRVLSSVRGRRVGRQRHARFKAIPGCRSIERARPQLGGSANKCFNAHHREPRPGEGTPVIATFRRDPFLLFSLTAGATLSCLCRVECHRRLAREAELGTVPPHPVKHHADPPGQGDGRALPAAQHRQTQRPGFQPVRRPTVQHHRGSLVERRAQANVTGLGDLADDIAFAGTGSGPASAPPRDRHPSIFGTVRGRRSRTRTTGPRPGRRRAWSPGGGIPGRRRPDYGPASRSR